VIKNIFLVVASFLLWATSYGGIITRFNHESHENGAFKTMQFNCSNCHNFTLGADNVQVKAEPALATSSLKANLQTLCHQCHNTKDARFKAVPKECVLCHNSSDLSKVIKPINHQNAAWKTTHSLNARIEGSSCLNCHIQADCLKCHLRRNDIEMVNHSRNFKFTHSVEARAQPHRCDACHTQNFCVKCHIGK
jgi:hypothetical protein